MSAVDLHIHSSVSDGKYTPAEVVKKAATAGVRIMALTDHDNVDGVAAALEAAREFPSLKVIPGAEISTEDADREVHILGYFVDCSSPELLEALNQLRESRLGRAEGMVVKLARLGYPVEWKRVLEIAGEGTVGRPHIALALLEKGYISTFKEAFDRFIANGGPAYVDRTKITPAEGISLILRAKGIPVMAHPLTGSHPNMAEAEASINALTKCGLMGIEAYYGEYSPDQVQTLVRIAKKNGLLATGGSDYHGLDENAEVGLGRADVPMSAAEALISAYEECSKESGRT